MSKIESKMLKHAVMIGMKHNEMAEEIIMLKHAAMIGRKHNEMAGEIIRLFASVTTMDIEKYQKETGEDCRIVYKIDCSENQQVIITSEIVDKQ